MIAVISKIILLGHQLKSFWKTILIVCGVAIASENAEDSVTTSIKAPVFGVSVELGWNSLASIGGMTLTYFPIPKLAVDLGAGFGLNAEKYGLRTRYFVRERAPFRTFIGLGLNRTGGWDPDGFEMNLSVNKGGTTREYDIRVRIDPTQFVDLMGGLEFRWGRLTASGALGYSQHIGRKHWHIISEEVPPAQDLEIFNVVLGSGIAAYAEFGFLY